MTIFFKDMHTHSHIHIRACICLYTYEHLHTHARAAHIRHSTAKWAVYCSTAYNDQKLPRANLQATLSRGINMHYFRPAAQSMLNPSPLTHTDKWKLSWTAPPHRLQPHIYTKQSRPLSPPRHQGISRRLAGRDE
jgi:hypothetical protein